jgi:hypothetical protein
VFHRETRASRCRPVGAASRIAHAVVGTANSAGVVRKHGLPDARGAATSTMRSHRGRSCGAGMSPGRSLGAFLTAHMQPSPQRHNSPQHEWVESPAPETGMPHGAPEEDCCEIKPASASRNARAMETARDIRGKPSLRGSAENAVKIAVFKAPTGANFRLPH